jgi:DNA topoisomerase-1
MESNLDKISNGQFQLKVLCDQCRKEIDLAIKNISKSPTKKAGKSNGSIPGAKKGIKIDENHRWIIGKYGPVIICDENGKVTFKKVKPDIDIEKLKNGGYKVEELLQLNITLGQLEGEDIIIKNGKFGLYFNFKGKNRSLKYLNKKINQITMLDVETVLVKKSTKSSILKNISCVASVRQGKFGPYVFYKTEQMKKPSFI